LPRLAASRRAKRNNSWRFVLDLILPTSRPRYGQRIEELAERFSEDRFPGGGPGIRIRGRCWPTASLRPPGGDGGFYVIGEHKGGLRWRQHYWPVGRRRLYVWCKFMKHILPAAATASARPSFWLLPAAGPVECDGESADAARSLASVRVVHRAKGFSRAKAHHTAVRTSFQADPIQRSLLSLPISARRVGAWPATSGGIRFPVSGH